MSDKQDCDYEGMLQWGLIGLVVAVIVICTTIFETAKLFVPPTTAASKGTNP
jgi:hypothetical protein